jgi:hypothetical protein
MLGGWTLRRSPLAAAVPLEGTDTVPGLRTLERLRAANLLNNGDASGAGRGAQPPRASRRQSYQRFKGPYIEQMTTQELQKDPKPWKLFLGDAEQGLSAQGFNVPASVDVLSERTEVRRRRRRRPAAPAPPKEPQQSVRSDAMHSRSPPTPRPHAHPTQENLVGYLPNYLRLAAAVVLLTFYLRPKALLGAAAVVYTMYATMTRAVQQQRRRQQQQQQQQQGGGGGGGAAAPAPPADPNDQLLAAATMVATWFVVAYTRCLPIMLLGVALAAAAVLLHAASRRGASEYRYRGRAPLGFSLWQVLGREAAPAGSDPRAVFKQLARGARQEAAQRAQWAGRWAKFYLLSTADAVRRRFPGRAQPGGGAWG